VIGGFAGAKVISEVRLSSPVVTSEMAKNHFSRREAKEGQNEKGN
jgi:hypothetical protein